MVARAEPRLTLAIPGRPVPWDRAGYAKGRFYTRDDRGYATWKQVAALSMQVAAAQQGWRRAEGPVALVVDAVWPLPKAMQRKAVGRAWRPVKSDGDNVLKAVQDSGNRVLWLDDALVVDARVRKWYAAPGEPPCVEIEAWEV